MSVSGDDLANLSPEQIALLALRLKKKQASFAQSSRPAELAPKHHALSFAQQRLWFLDQLTPNSPVYNVTVLLGLEGVLDPKALERSLSEILRRHASLRTKFARVEDQIVQVVAPPHYIELPVLSLGSFDEANRCEEIERIALSSAQQHFDLSGPQLWRATLIRERTDRHLLVLTVHHIVFDGWSAGIFYRELGSLYTSFLSGGASNLAELAIQYTDFARLQHRKFEQGAFNAHLDYWKQQLADLSILEFPTDYDRPKHRSYQAAVEEFIVAPETVRALNDLGLQNSATSFMTLFAAFNLLLHRYTGQPDIVVGTDVANRTLPGSESVIGFFVNQLALRTDLAGDPSFIALLKRVRTSALSAYEHQDLPFDQLVSALQPKRSVSQAPLFQVKFVLQNAPLPTVRMPALSLAPKRLLNGFVGFDFILSMEETADGLKGILEYSTELFRPATMRRFARHFVHLLQRIAVQPETRLSDFEFLDDEERRQLLVDFNETDFGPYQPECINKLFEAQVQRQPDALAIVSGERRLTYGELNGQANRLAHYLQSMGVRPELVVALCLERTPETIIGILGILKAGGAYLPLDPAYPRERLTYILEQSGAPFILTQERFADALPASWSLVVSLDAEADAIATQNEDNPQSGVTPDNLAYIIYTSGSTGTPKGVMIEHGSVSHLVRWQARNFNVTPSSRISQLSTYSFDGAVGETFMALLNGATLYMLSRDQLDASRLVKEINEYEINVMVTVPSLLKELDVESLAVGKNLTIVAVGEACPLRLASTWSRRCNFVNAYGPTEYTVYSHLWNVDEEFLTAAKAVPIGRPIHNTKSYILDRKLKLVPIGVTGELYIAGPGIARGYLNSSDVTAEKFVPAWFAGAQLNMDGKVTEFERARREIDEFKKRKNDAPEIDRVRHLDWTHPTSVEAVYKIVKTLDADLVEKTHQFIAAVEQDSGAYKGFCRYLLEAVNGSYASAGINEDILRVLFPLDDFENLQGIDFGFGSGEIMRGFAKLGVQMKGIDFNPVFVQQARDRGENVEMARLDIPAQSFVAATGVAQGSRDIAIMTLVLDRLEAPANALRNLFLTLKEGGRFAVQALLPLVGIDDGDIETPITYTPAENRIAPGRDAVEDRNYLVALISELGGRGIKLHRLRYVVSSRDGVQEYHVCGITGYKSTTEPAYFSPGHRMYRTGDIARYLDDGNIEFIGRTDEQVKVRGYRVDLLEIEKALTAHPAVKDCVAVAVDDTDKTRRIAAYFTTAKTEPPAPNELRAFLKQRLPTYMLPAAFISLDKFPLLPSGKVDRRQIAARGWPVQATERTITSPRNELEEKLTDTWKQVLKLGDVGIHDNVFELGGDSLLILQIVAHLMDHGIELRVDEFFEHQTIAELAQIAASRTRSENSKDPESGEVPLTSIQHWFFAQNLPEPHHYNQSVILRLEQKLTRPLLEAAIKQLFVHHAALRLRFERTNTGWKQFISKSDEHYPLTFVDLSNLPEDERRHAMHQAADTAQAGLNLAHGPLARFVLFDSDSDKGQWLLIIAHHLVVDAFSWRILLKDLEAVYLRLRSGEDVLPPPKSTSFRAWAEAQARQAEALGEQLPSWYDEMLKLSYQPLPCDYPGGENKEDHARTFTISLSASDTAALLEKSASNYRAQIDEVLLAALSNALAQEAGSGNFLIDVEAHGRESHSHELNVSRTVGWFTSVFSVCVAGSANATLEQVLRSAKERLREARLRGQECGLLRYRGGHVSEKLRAQPEAEIIFNNLGRLDHLLSDSIIFSSIDQGIGAVRSRKAARRYKLEINTYILSGMLHLAVTYSERQYQDTTIEALAQAFLETLRKLIDAEIFKPEAILIASDFPLARRVLSKLDREKFDALLGTYSNVEDISTVTPLQQGMIYHTLYAPASGVFINQLVCIFKGKFDTQLFVRAWEMAAAHYPVLRTAFIWEKLEEPLQFSSAKVTIPYEEVDWRDHTVIEQEALTEAYLLAARQKGFDLRDAPLLRLALMRLSDDLYQCVWSFHHLLLDGWSVSMLLEEVLRVYDSLRAGHENVRPSERASSAGYLAWLERQDTNRARVFWQRYLTGITSPTALVKDRSIEPAEMFSGTWGRQRRHLTTEETDALKDFAKQHQLTLNTLIQGAWGMLLSRYGNEETVVFGQVVAGRPSSLAGSNSMLGLFINTLPVRMDVPSSTAPIIWLKGLQRDSTELREYEYSSLMSIQQWSQLPSHVPLFESVLVFENYPIGESLTKYDGEFSIHAVRALEQTNYPLTVIIVPGTELSLEIIYSEAMFDAQTIERMLVHVQSLLMRLSDNTAATLAELSPLTAAERHCLLFEWNNTVPTRPAEQCIAELFESQAASTPEAVALRYGREVVTFAELNHRANQLAGHLRREGVKLEDVVGLLVERSIDAVVAILGVLKAGGAYLPLDPAAPAQRLQSILDEAQAGIVITHRTFADALPQKERLAIISLDDQWGEIAREDANNRTSGAGADNLACIIYTSGSTGTPKGVAQTQGALLNRFKWMWEAYPFQPDEVCCQKTSLTFVDSVWETLGPLLRGIPLVIIPDQVVKNPAELFNTLASEGVTRIVLVPSLLRVFMETCAEKFAQLELLKLWVVSGEPLPSSLLTRLDTLAPNAILLNLYGSSEVAADVSCYAVKGTAVSTPTVPIGLPIANTTIHLLDREMRMVPVGIPGDVYVGGLNLARGYLNRPDSTADRFVPDPMNSAEGARLYRTGDVARRLPDGNIEWLGRIDRQVKLRGFRIELEEVETALSAHPSVAECAVLLRKTTSEDEKLEAYFVPATFAAPEVSELRNFLARRLPDYMIPTGFAPLTQMPHLSSGKIDRRALLNIGAVHSSSRNHSARPRTKLERQIAGIWRRVLNVDDIRVDDNFFEVGGNSLLLINLNQKLSAEIERDVPLVELTFYPTIGSLARHLSEIATTSQTHAGDVERGRERKLMKSQQRHRRRK